MKYIKKFENVKIEPKIGDYVIIEPSSLFVHGSTFSDLTTKEFISNNIGQITHIQNPEQCRPIISVRYFNIPSHLIKFFHTYCRDYRKDEIVEISKNKEELELKLQAKKYNL